MPTPILDLASATTGNPPTSLTRTGSNALGKNEFLKLLVAQLANQDPTKPQDSSQFVAELAQFSSLEQQQNAVSRLDTLLMGQATANQTSAASFIGKDVSYHGGTVHFDGVSPAITTATLGLPADKVTVAVADATGRVVRTIPVGAAGSGELAVVWDGKNDQGLPAPAGDYTMAPAAFDADGKAIPITLATTGTVTGVSFEDGVPRLKVGGSLVKMSDVTSINERNTP